MTERGPRSKFEVGGFDSSFWKLRWIEDEVSKLEDLNS